MDPGRTRLFGPEASGTLAAPVGSPLQSARRSSRLGAPVGSPLQSLTGKCADPGEERIFIDEPAHLCASGAGGFERAVLAHANKCAARRHGQDDPVFTNEAFDLSQAEDRPRRQIQ